MTRADITRRGLLTGLGAAGGAALIGRDAAQATPTSPAGGASGGSVQRPASPPDGIPTPIASAPQAGVKYYFRDFEEFIPEQFASGRNWGGVGIYTPTSSSLLSTSFDVPAGALVHDIEWYVFNSSGTSQSLLLRVFSAGSGQILGTVIDGAAPSTGGVAAVRLVPTSTSNGPFPHGTRLVAACFGSTTSNFQVNGVRVGLANAPLSPVLLPSPVRIVDSRTTGGPLHNGATRTVSLASHIPAGALGALLNLTAVNTIGGGFLTTYAAGTPTPSTSSLNWYASNQVVANQVTTAVSAARAITLFCHSQTNFIVDLVGYLV